LFSLFFNLKLITILIKFLSDGFKIIPAEPVFILKGVYQGKKLYFKTLKTGYNIHILIE